MNTENIPQHPGAYLSEIQPEIISKTALAAKLNMSRTTLWKFIRGKTRLKPDLAAILGDITGDGTAFWLKLQHAWDLWQAERTS